jgi:hypothetical protein
MLFELEKARESRIQSRNRPENFVTPRRKPNKAERSRQEGQNTVSEPAAAGSAATAAGAKNRRSNRRSICLSRNLKRSENFATPSPARLPAPGGKWARTPTSPDRMASVDVLTRLVAATQPEEDAERLVAVTLAEEEARAALVAAQESSPLRQRDARSALVDAQQRKAKLQQKVCLRLLCPPLALVWGRALQRARRHGWTITILLLAALVLALLVRVHRHRDEIRGAVHQAAAGTSAAVREEVVPRLGEEWSRVVWANSQATRLRHYLDSAVYAATHSPTLPPHPRPGRRHRQRPRPRSCRAPPQCAARRGGRAAHAG